MKPWHLKKKCKTMKPWHLKKIVNLDELSMAYYKLFSDLDGREWIYSTCPECVIKKKNENSKS